MFSSKLRGTVIPKKNMILFIFSLNRDIFRVYFILMLSVSYQYSSFLSFCILRIRYFVEDAIIVCSKNFPGLKNEIQ